MPYRTFVDSAGSEWQVWDIVPRLTERRVGGVPDRRVAVKPISFADRRQTGRRLTQVRRAVLRGTYAHGWLCFENDREKRRLSPIPDNWTSCSDELLEVYSRHAERVATAPRNVDLGDSAFAEAG